ncbi:General stress protein 26 [Goodfellowiella coeruleoviolacea]|uniref:General stress protein 26 n=1 Tax=Goodfellowiella coeruleoviolacea TaxID=334858 RepID=A0AAE3G9P5_9PSEU|nr:General stress protein 26 [Goodfellowiella coeruleoviolacea]
MIREFVRIAHGVVWCTLATVDDRGRPRSRVVHPYWERTDHGVTGWLFTRPASLKVAHLARHPHASCSYWSPSQETAVAECDAEIDDTEPVRRRVWALFATAAEPLGYDPRILGADDHRDPSITVLRLTPWRLRTPGGVWRRAASHPA